jgi:dUTP pyrophosphatase
MNILKIEVESDEFIPTRQHMSDVGYDLKANVEDEVVVAPNSRMVIGTGVKIQLPEGYEASIRPRSGLAAKHGIMLVNSPGTIDSGYRGEVKVILYNSDTRPFTIHRFDRIAQMVLNKVELPTLVVGKVNESDRGEKGLGSTGLKKGEI